MQIVALGMLETEICFLKLSGIFFFSNIFDPRLIRVTSGEPKDMEVRLQLNTNHISGSF